MSRHNSKQIENVKVMLLKGENGSDIESIEKTGTDGLVDTYTVTMTDGSKATFTVTNGNHIISIEKTSTVDNIDTYTVTMADGTTSIFTVTNGTNFGVENLADVAPSLVAQKDYEVNEHLIYNEVYYIVTQAVQTGDNLVVGTNIEQRRVGDEISFIANIRVENSVLILPRTGVSVTDKILSINMFN